MGSGYGAGKAGGRGFGACVESAILRRLDAPASDALSLSSSRLFAPRETPS